MDTELERANAPRTAPEPEEVAAPAPGSASAVGPSIFSQQSAPAVSADVAPKIRAEFVAKAFLCCFILFAGIFLGVVLSTPSAAPEFRPHSSKK